LANLTNILIEINYWSDYGEAMKDKRKKKYGLNCAIPPSGSGCARLKPTRLGEG
jgi:hypothetical protein